MTPKMGRNIHMKHAEDEVEDMNPSCIRVLIDAIDYHQWRYNVQKILPYKRTQSRRSKGYESSNLSSEGYDFTETLALLNEDQNLLPSTKRRASTKRRSLRACIKKLIRHPIIKERNENDVGSNSFQSRLQQSFSIHHRKFPDHDRGDISSDWDRSIIFIPGSKDRKRIIGSKMPEEKLFKLTKKDAYKDKPEEHSDVLKIYKGEEKQFLEIQENAGNGTGKFPECLPCSMAKARLMKSGSFPAANLSRCVDRNTLCHKQIEKWCCLRWEKFPHDTPLIKDALRHYYKDLKSGILAENIRGVKPGLELSCILASKRRSDEEKGFLRSRKREEYMFNKTGHRRICSLDESLDKYTLLFETNFGKERRLRSSTSLKLRNREEMQSWKNYPIQFRRIHSFLNMEECSLWHGVHGEVNDADWPVMSSKETMPQVELNLKFSSARTPEETKPDDSEDSRAQYEMLQTDCCDQEINFLAESIEISTAEFNARLSDRREGHDEPVVEKTKSNTDQMNSESTISFSEFPTSTHESCSQDEVYTVEELQFAEGEEKCDHFQEESSIDWQKSMNLSSAACIENLPDSEKIEDVDGMDDLEDSKSGNKDNTDADYMRDVLECSGFTKDAMNSTWHSREKPLIPSLYEEIEAFLHQELKCHREDICSSHHYQLLLDLVNEELIHLHDRSSSYYPNALSSSCQIRRFPVGNKILEEICGSISALMNLTPEEKESMDGVVDLDLRRDDSWMNLQLESECIALRVEDMILHELLEEFTG